jgi:excinuclease ABC subunit C
LRELELIRRWRPHFNVHGQPHRRRRAFLCLGRRPAPYAFLTTRPPAGVLACFGPVFPGTRTREAVRRVNDWFALRDCPQKQEMIFADQAELFPIDRTAGCLRYEIGTCLGPCAAACSRADYRERVRAARAFLDGTGPGPLKALERDMLAASTAQEFERAAALRDKLAALQWLDAHLERLRRARDQHTFIYPVAGHEGRDLWYVIRRGWVAASLPPPREQRSREAAADLLRSVYERPQLAHEPANADELDLVLLVAAWFRKHPGERERVLDPGGVLAEWRKSADAIP